jgi:hypothetical protein
LYCFLFCCERVHLSHRLVETLLTTFVRLAISQLTRSVIRTRDCSISCQTPGETFKARSVGTSEGTGVVSGHLKPNVKWFMQNCSGPLSRVIPEILAQHDEPVSWTRKSKIKTALATGSCGAANQTHSAAATHVA